jgi:PAS domain S-box-containing protein
MIGKTEFDFLPKKEAEKSLQDHKKVIETGKSIINEIEKITDKKGIEHWVSVTLIPRYNNIGKIIGTMGINREITEIKKSEEKYKSLFETANDPIVIVDKRGRFLDVNEQVLKLLNFSKRDLIGKRFDKVDIMTEESLAIASNNFAKRMKGETVPTYEIKIVTKHGEIIPAEINANALYENGEIVGDLIILRDLRERYKRKKAEEDLYDSETRFRNIFDSTSDFLLYLEKDVILDINEMAMKLTNLKKQEVIGKRFNILVGLFSEEDMKKHTDAIKSAMMGSEINDYETELITPGGIRYKFSFSCDCIKEDKKVQGIIIRGRDITQRQRAWDELVRLEEKYRILAETSADGVITIDPLGRLTYVNPAFENMCHRRKSQILATLFRDYLSDDSVYFFQQLFIDARKKDEKIENVELELVHANGDIIPLEVNIAPFKKDNEFAGMVCTIRDITERRRVENELKKSERLKTEFMNIAAHELKSPVTPIKGYLDLIISSKDANDQIKDWAKVSLRNAERLLKLVNDILDVSRLDTDTMRFEMEKIETIEILSEIVEDMKPAVENKNIKFIAEIPKELPSIVGDRYRLSQVLKNLLVNALKFTDHGSISIKADKKEDYIIITIKDTGIGISKNEVRKIFNKFYQAYTGDDRKNEGTGLGLFICKEILQKHGGKIWVKSTLGKGSTFFIQLPYLHKMVLDPKN